MKLIRFVIVVYFVSTFGSGAALAQADKGANGAKTGAQPPKVGAQALPPVDNRVSHAEVVVTGRRGEAKVEAESEFSEAEISAQGADNIRDLLSRLITQFIGAGDKEPVLLINGKPADGDRSIKSYPTEALDRIAILKPEAAARYGYPAGKRVVNLVTKKKFASVIATTGTSWATAGGQQEGGLTGERTVINGDTRWNIEAVVTRQNDLRKSERNVPPRTGPFDSVGFVSGLNGGQVDPALSLAVGSIVTVAAIPTTAGTRTPTLADFAANANATNPVDPNSYETLRSSNRSLNITAGVTRPLGAFSASLGLNARASGSDGLRGLPMAAVVIPVGNPWSPFANAVVLNRPFAGKRPLRIENSSRSIGLTFDLSGPIGSWKTSFSTSFTRSWDDILLERGIDVGRLQSLVNAGDPEFNPFGPLNDTLLLSTRTGIRRDILTARFNMSKAILDLPAGPLTTNFTVEGGHNRSESRREEAARGMTIVDRRTLGQASGTLGVSLPLSRRGEAAPWALGDLSFDLSATGYAQTRSGLRKRVGGGLNWSPISVVQLRGSFDRLETAPSFTELDAPVTIDVVRLFDFVRQEGVDVLRSTGGNPDLPRGIRNDFSLTARVLPWNPALALNIGYRRTSAKRGVASFPQLTPVIEAAFPERVTRDGEGRLIAIDARPIAILSDLNTEFTSGVTLRLPKPRRKSDIAKPPPNADPPAADPPAADPWQFTAILNHRWLLKSELLTRPGVPVIDRLNGGGQSRHTFSWNLSAGKTQFGISLYGDWNSAFRLRNSTGNAVRDFRLKPPVTASLSAFMAPQLILPERWKNPWLANVKVTLAVRNILNGYRRVTYEDGSTPPGYSREEIDPVGRTMSVKLRKRF